MRRAFLLGPLLLAMAQAQVPTPAGTPSLQGYTGLLNIPDALVAPEGHLWLAYNNQIDARWAAPSRWWDTHLWTFGLAPHLEGGFRFTEGAGSGLRDLSMHAKFQIPGLPEWAPRLAIGSQDYPGAAPHFRTNYAVATQLLGPARITVGYGNGPQRMKGAFGGLDLRITEWMQVLGEHDTRDRNVGLRLSLPSGWLPEGMRFGALVKRALGKEAGNRSDVAVFARIPLGREVARRQQRLEVSGAANPAPSLRVGPAAVPASAPTTPAEPRSLATALARQGFEEIQVGTLGQTLVVRLENGRYNHSELDGMGVALGLAARQAGAQVQDIRLELLNHGLRMLTVEAPAALLRSYLLGTDEAADAVQSNLLGHLRVTGAGQAPAGGEAAFAEGPERRRFLRPRIVLQPGLASSIGTEVGAFDYRLSLQPEVLLPLWTGAGVVARWDMPLAWSENYRPEGLFGTRGTDTRMDRLLLQQAVPVLPGVVTQFSAGLTGYKERGWMNQTVWTPGDGTHQFQVTGGRSQTDDRYEREVLIGAYRLYVPSLDSHLQVSYGTFQNQDTGYRLDLRRHFGDTVLSLFYARTTFAMGGFSLSVPLTPRRDMKPGPVQVRGSEQWRWGQATTLHTRDYNPYVPGLAETPTSPNGLREALLDHDRLKASYLRNHLPRLREAFHRYGSR